MQEVLEEHALDARRLVLAQPGDGLVGRADDPVAGELGGVRVRVSTRLPWRRPTCSARRATSSRSAPTTTPVMSETTIVDGSRPTSRQASWIAWRFSAASSGDAKAKLYSSAHRAPSRAPRGAALPPTMKRRVRLLDRLGQGRRGPRPCSACRRTLNGPRLEGAVHDLQLLGVRVHPVAQRREREPVRAVLGLHPAGAEADLDASVGDVVGRGRELREHAGVPERRRRDERAQAQLRRDRGEGVDRPPGVERPATWSPSTDR